MLPENLLLKYPDPPIKVDMRRLSRFLRGKAAKFLIRSTHKEPSTKR
jgi:hypothetical protein